MKTVFLANMMKMAQFLAQHLFYAKVEYVVYQRKDGFLHSNSFRGYISVLSLEFKRRVIALVRRIQS